MNDQSLASRSLQHTSWTASADAALQLAGPDDGKPTKQLGKKYYTGFLK
jgi:hypothetical protein